MQDWENQIQKDKEDRRRSVEYVLNLNNERDDLIKGAVGEYGALSNLSITKKGSEIKEKLQIEKMKVGALIIVCSEKMHTLIKDIGEEPTLNEEGEKRYTYEQLYPETESVNGKTHNETDKTNKMRDYNNHFNKYKSLSKESKYINTLVSNIQDNKLYDLPQEYYLN